jgi:hypothetical protein
MGVAASSRVGETWLVDVAQAKREIDAVIYTGGSAERIRGGASSATRTIRTGWILYCDRSPGPRSNEATHALLRLGSLPTEALLRSVNALRRIGAPALTQTR